MCGRPGPLEFALCVVFVGFETRSFRQRSLAWSDLLIWNQAGVAFRLRTQKSSCTLSGRRHVAFHQTCLRSSRRGIQGGSRRGIRGHLPLVEKVIKSGGLIGDKNEAEMMGEERV